MTDTIFIQEVVIPAGDVKLDGILALPRNVRSAVIFVHGSGSSRLSPRNTFVARTLNSAGIGTLLFDLLTREEDRVYENRFDIDLLTDRLRAATMWFINQPRTADLPVGYFGASTGTAAALRAAADLGTVVKAVVSRGGRPDLAEQALPRVQAPVLLIVGGSDDLVIELNQRAFRLIRTEKDMRIVPRATHLFEEPGALEEVAQLAVMWLSRHLIAPAVERKKRAS